MKIDDVIIGESYAARYSSQRHEVLRIDKVDEPTYSSRSGRGTRQVRKPFVRIHHYKVGGVEGMTHEEYVLARELTEPWDTYAARRAAMDERSAAIRDARRELEAALTAAGLAFTDTEPVRGFRAHPTGGLSLVLMTEQSDALAAFVKEHTP